MYIICVCTFNFVHASYFFCNTPFSPLSDAFAAGWRRRAAFYAGKDTPIPCLPELPAHEVVSSSAAVSSSHG